VRVRGTRPHLGCHPYRLHQFLACRALAQRGFGVTADAVGALRDMGDSDGNQLLFRLNVWNASCGSGVSHLCASDKAPVDEG
jgi:hypothetical protein